jgi:uncharacterized protein (DUF952 family)
MRATFHLVPAEVWAVAEPALEKGTPYAAASLATEGFIHCTDGVDELAATFDRYYAGDPRPILALTLDLDALDVPWRYDVPGSPYPHVYGPISLPAVPRVDRVERAPGGGFAGLVTLDGDADRGPG